MEGDVYEEIVETYEFCCTLCFNAKDLIDQLAAHYKAFHTEAIACEDFSAACECIEVRQLQALLVNHLLAHFLPKSRISQALSQEEKKGEQEEEEEEEEIIEEYIENLEEEFVVEYRVEEEEAKEEEEENKLEEEDQVVYFEEYILEEEGEEEEEEEATKKQTKKCSECNATYASQKGLQAHFHNEHEPTNPFKCPQCSNRFATEKRLRSHLNKHEAEQSMLNGQYFCRICGKPCANKARLLAHRLTHQLDFECDFCGKRFTKFEFMRRHVLQHRFGRPRRDPNDLTGKLVCAQCSRYVPKDRMKRHLFIFHSDERPYACEVENCGKTFKYLEPFNNHMDRHRNAPKYRCEHCGKSFFNKSNLRAHALRHTDPDRFRCNTCGERFGSTGSLKMHLRRQHEAGEKSEFRCADCGKIFQQLASLKNHVNQAHRESGEAEEEPRSCNYCSYTCHRLKNLQKHMARVHKVRKRAHRVFPTEKNQVN